MPRACGTPEGSVGVTCIAMTDPGLEALKQVESDEDRLRVEEELLEQTNNRPQDGDPLQPEEQ